MKKKAALSGVLAAAVTVWMFVFSVSGQAQNEKKRGPFIQSGESGAEFIKKFDLDKDGKISHEEWEAVKPTTVYREKHWPDYDINKDGSITMDEVPEKSDKAEPAPLESKKKAPTAAQIAFIVKYDKNQDGKLSRDEFPGKFFDVYDRNHDGFIEPEEAPSGKTAY
jgi:Ca2+-binding EF-hand superfamily protein